MLVHFINMKFNGDLREETFKILFLEIVPGGNDSNLLIVFYVQIMPDDFVMQLHRF
ncbi:beta-galactosidase [Escherichia coli]|nr:beta-galactosidase [Escherichia coli]